MQNFDFHNPTKMIFGRDTVGRIGEEIRQGGCGKVILIAGGGSIRKNGVYDTVAESLQKAGISWTEAWGVKPNPVLSRVREMIRQAKDEKVEAVFAVGGGSVIDTAKTVAAGCLMEDVWQAFETKDPVREALPLYTVLTISATGSEMNGYAVITHEQEKKKWNISGTALYPRVSIVDPSVQMSLPWRQTVNGALDAMSHIMEQYFMGLGAETTLAVNEALFRTILTVTDALEKNPRDYNNRASLAWAATLALNGISQAGQGTGDWATHGLEHGVSAFYPHVAHGAGLGVIFPAWITYCHEANPLIFKRWAKNIWGCDRVEEGVGAMKAKIKSWGAATTLRELGVDDSRLSAIAEVTLKYGMTGAVKTLTGEDMVRVLKLAEPG